MPLDSHAGPVAAVSRTVEGILCPVCNSADAVRRVSQILDTSVTRTEGFSEHSDWSESYHSFTTKTAQVDRFDVSGSPIPLGAVLAVLGFAAAATLAISFPYFAPLVVALPWYLYRAHNHRTDFEGRAAAHKSIQERVRSGYYCARDDVAFLPGQAALPPSEFVQRVSQMPTPTTASKSFNIVRASAITGGLAILGLVLTLAAPDPLLSHSKVEISPKVAGSCWEARLTVGEDDRGGIRQETRRGCGKQTLSFTTKGATPAVSVNPTRGLNGKDDLLQGSELEVRLLSSDGSVLDTDTGRLAQVAAP